MKRSSWWHVAVLGAAAVLSAIVLLDASTAADRIVGVSAALAIVVGWFALGQFCSTQSATEAPSADGIRSLAFTVILVVATGVGVAAYPSFAIVQGLVFPLLWTTWSRLLWALLANTALAAAVTIGFIVALGTSPAAIGQAVLTGAISLGFSIALGMWFSRVYDLVHERQALIDQLEAAQDQLAALSREAGAAGERDRLRREIHDTIAQDLTGLVLTAQRARRELRSGSVPAAHEQIDILEDNARAALIETRALVESGSATGADGGLTTALNRLGERFERETGVSVAVRAAGTTEIDRDSEVVLLRCAQEALANVRKHSRATAASITVTATYNAVILRVSDNGAGFDATLPSDGFGLAGMRDRLALAGGTLELLTEPGRGTALVATLPMPGMPPLVPTGAAAVQPAVTPRAPAMPVAAPAATAAPASPTGRVSP
ncbi:sensor histidine kinase [Glaciihabitans sp. dw_435]|uniref:sensor histidine kinase n=1 Tax=Glaciihabitans sp. dw_435 TaxID=2720081 RepID=UPI001BD39394|nr:sensor histidine kinase [Glaciihabitans sp. dw_435]